MQTLLFKSNNNKNTSIHKCCWKWYENQGKIHTLSFDERFVTTWHSQTSVNRQAWNCWTTFAFILFILTTTINFCDGFKFHFRKLTRNQAWIFFVPTFCLSYTNGLTEWTREMFAGSMKLSVCSSTKYDRVEHELNNCWQFHQTKRCNGS